MTRTKILPRIIRRGLLSWLTAVLIEYSLLPKGSRDLSAIEAVECVNSANILLMTGVFFALLSLIRRIGSTERTEKCGIIMTFFLLSVFSVKASFRYSFLGACVLIVLILLVYFLRGWDGSTGPYPRVKDKKRTPVIVTVILSVLAFLLLCVWTVSRVYSFSAPTYDFGIFSQMFHSMRTVGQPLTTLERDGLMSHFAVHVSPIYYLLLPVYAIVPHPATLQVLQALIVTTSVIPLWKLGKLHGFGRWKCVLLCTTLLLYPAFSGGVGYDLHENCFLMPWILWIFYGIEKGNTALTFTTAILTLSVKEDAPVYVAVIALWLLLTTGLYKGERKHFVIGLCLLLLSILWFFAATAYLKCNGEGVMSSRYRNFMSAEGGSLWSVIRCALTQPMKILYEASDPDKLRYLALTILPLLGMPLLTRRYERYILLIPYILVNLMPDYPYQHEIFYQYSFGTTAFLFYLTVVNAGDIRYTRWKTGVLSATTVLCAVAFAVVIIPKATYYPTKWMQQREVIRQVRQALATIPEEAAVTASTFYTVELSQRQRIYDLGYASREHLLESEFIVIDPRGASLNKKYATPGKDDGLENLLILLHRMGYERWATVEGCLYIYRKTEGT